MNNIFRASVFLLTTLAITIFVGSCVITLSDGQGALIFIFSIPAMVLLLLLAVFLSRKIKPKAKSVVRMDYFPKIVACLIALFFIFSFIPGLRNAPDRFMEYVGIGFKLATGKTPYAFFKDRSSFQNKLALALKSQKKINFSDLDLTFAWDKVCIFGPYANNEKVKSVLKMNWNIEERSQIYYSDSINALVFLYQGSVNQVVDLRRGIADFKDLDFCLSREQANFDLEVSADGAKFLKPGP